MREKNNIRRASSLLTVILSCLLVIAQTSNLLPLWPVKTASAQSSPDTTAPVCGVNNNGSNIVPSGASVTKINGTTIVSWHDFVTQTLAVGDYWTDLAYGCFAKMLTNSRTLNAAQSQQYALSSALDKSDCYVMAQNPDSGNSSQFVIAAPTQDCPSGNFGTWGQTVLTSGQMPARTSHNEFVWDYFTQGEFWYANGNIIGECTITGIGSSSCATKHTFSEYAGGGCIFIDYAAMNQNGMIDTFCQATSGGTMDIFMYDTVHDVKSAVYTTACTGTLNTNQPGCVHKIAITPNNGILVQFNGNACGNESGNHYWAYPTPANPMPQIECKTDHVDVAGDLTTPTKDRAFYEDFQDNPGPWPGCTFGFKPTSTLLPLSGNPQCAFDQSNTANFNAGWDISTRGWPARAWVLYSMQGGSNNTTVSPAMNCNSSGSYADPSSTNWSNNGVGRLENELLLVRSDAQGNFAKIWRLGLTHQRGPCASNNFYADPRAPQSMDGKYIVFATNARWGASGGGPGSQVDIVVMGGSVNGSGVLGPLFSSTTLQPPQNLNIVVN